MKIRVTPFLFFSLFFLVHILNSCGKPEGSTENPTTPTTVADDKAFINTVSTNTNNCIKAARDGNLSQSIIQFLSLSNGVVGNENWVDSMSTELENVMGTLQLDPNNSKFDFPAYWGTYNWNRVTKKFTKTAAVGIFINFPSAPTQLTNNVAIAFTVYTDGLYQANAKNIYLPKTAKATMTKDNVVVADMNFTGSYSSGSFPIPINLLYTIVLAPHTYTFSVQEVTTTQFKFASSIISGGGCGINITATITFNNDDYNNFTIENDLKTVQAQYQSGDLSVKSNWDAKTYYLFNNPTTLNLNSTLSNSVYNKTDKIAELKFLDVAGVRKLYIYYKDGTSENTSVYYDPFTTNLKNILRPMFGNDVDTWF